MALWAAGMAGVLAQAAVYCAVPATQMMTVGAPPVAAVACTAPEPAVGQAFEGTVLHVFDGRTLCVAQGPHPSQWIRAKLEDSTDASARPAVMSALFARHVDCRVVGRSAEGAVVRCTVAGVAVGKLISSPANRAAAEAWR